MRSRKPKLFRSSAGWWVIVQWRRDERGYDRCYGHYYWTFEHAVQSLARQIPICICHGQ